jgi:integrase
MPKQRKRDGVYWRRDRGAWWLSFVDASGKRQRQPALGANNHEEARACLEEERRTAREQAKLKPGEVLTCRASFADVVDRFLAYQKPRLDPESYRREKGIAAHLKAFFTDRLADITSSQVSDYVTVRLGKVSKSSVRKELNTLKHLFRLVCGEWKLLPRFSNPCLDVMAPKFRDERTQHLSPDQFRRVLAAAPEKMRPVFALLTATGMRRSELLECRWKCVDAARILLPTSKNDEPKEIHLNVFAQQVLASIPQGEPEDRLFPDVTPDAATMAFHHVCEQLGISDIRLHDLRHTFATWLRQGGTALDIIASQLGHRDLRMTKRYARIASAQVRDAVSGLDSVLSVTQEDEKALVSHPFVTGTPALPEGKPVTQ